MCRKISRKSSVESRADCSACSQTEADCRRIGRLLFDERFGPLFRILLLGLQLLFAQAAAGQVVDSTKAALRPDLMAAPRPDSIDAREFLPDSTSFAIKMDFYRDSLGVSLNQGRPVRRAFLNLPDLLKSGAGMMPIAFGSAGWPDSFSPFGLDPNRIDLRLDNRLMNDLITGRPRFDLVPYALIGETRTVTHSAASVYDIRAVSRSFSSPEPITDLRYSSSGAGLQSIDAVHVQSRRFPLFDPDDRIELLFGYAGAAADGEYPGSRLERARQIQSRIRFARPTWSLEVYELYNRRNVGAHGGVVPRSGQPYSSIYQRVGASVESAEAARTTVRNDLSARFRTTALVVPLLLDGFWTAQTLQYRASADTVTARVRRTGVAAATNIGLGQARLQFALTTWLDRYRSGNAFQDGFDKEILYTEFISRGSATLGRVDVNAHVGFHSDGGRSFVSAYAELALGGVMVQGSTTGVRSSWMDRAGFGPLSTPLESIPGSRLDRLSISGRASLGMLHGSVTAFLNRTSDFPSWSVNRSSDETVSTAITGTLTTTGISLELGFRSREDLGLYGIFRPTLLNRSASESSESVQQERSSVPEMWANGRLGVHALLFKRDLDLDLSVRIFYWDSMIGRRLDPRTGLLMLPKSGNTYVSSSWTFDVVAEAGVRTATLFFAYENIFSGTNALIGNLLVPDYPLPAQRFRFGVFWPITN